MGILNVLLFSFLFSWKKMYKEKLSFCPKQYSDHGSRALSKRHGSYQNVKILHIFCLVYNKTRKCRAIEQGRCLRTQTHAIFNTSILYYNWFHWDLNPTKKPQNRWSSKLQTKIKMIWILIVMGHIHLL